MNNIYISEMYDFEKNPPPPIGDESAMGDFFCDVLLKRFFITHITPYNPNPLFLANIS